MRSGLTASVNGLQTQCSIMQVLVFWSRGCVYEGPSHWKANNGAHWALEGRDENPCECFKLPTSMLSLEDQFLFLRSELRWFHLWKCCRSFTPRSWTSMNGLHTQCVSEGPSVQSTSLSFPKHSIKNPIRNACSIGSKTYKKNQSMGSQTDKKALVHRRHKSNHHRGN